MRQPGFFECNGLDVNSFEFLRHNIIGDLKQNQLCLTNCFFGIIIQIMKDLNRKPLHTAVLKILAPLVRILLSMVLSFCEFAKWVYVDIG